MKRLKTIIQGVLAGVLATTMLSFPSIASAAGGSGVIDPASAQTALRPELAKLLQQAQTQIQTKKFTEVRETLAQIDAIKAKTPYEVVAVDCMRGAAAAVAGDAESAAAAFAGPLSSGRLNAKDQQDIFKSVSMLYYKDKKYAEAADWSQRYFKAGGREPKIAALLGQSYYLQKNYAQVASFLQGFIQSQVTAGVTPDEVSLQLLANSYALQKSYADVLYPMELLVTYYPKKNYWNDLVSCADRAPNFPERLMLDAYRLQFAVAGELSGANDYMDAADLSIEAGFPIEAQRFIDHAVASHVLGNGGANAPRLAKIKALIAQKTAAAKKNAVQSERNATAAKDGNASVDIGFNDALNGDFDKGTMLIQQGIMQGSLKHPEDAMMRLGIAQFMDGKIDAAINSFAQVPANADNAALARYWSIFARQH